MSSITDWFGFGGFEEPDEAASTHRPHVEGQFDDSFYLTFFEVLQEDMRKFRAALEEQQNNPLAAILRQLTGIDITGTGSGKNPNVQAEVVVVKKDDAGNIVPVSKDDVALPPEIAKFIQQMMDEEEKEEKEEEKEKQEQEDETKEDEEEQE